MASPYSKLKRWRKRSKWALITVVGIASIIYPFIPDAPTEQAVTDAPLAEQSVIPDFSRYDRVEDKKQAFFDYLKPIVEAENEHILEQRLFLLAVQEIWQIGAALTPLQQQRLARIAEFYEKKTPSNHQQLTRLLHRVDIIPVDLVLVQAANESAWGTSRFARLGYNFFGMWCFSEGCGFVPRQRSAGASHEVAKFDSLRDAVRGYLENINTNSAYQDLRKIRANLRRGQAPIDAERLAMGLMRYSQRGEAYIDELILMIQINREYIT